MAAFVQQKPLETLTCLVVSVFESMSSLGIINLSESYNKNRREHSGLEWLDTK